MGSDVLKRAEEALVTLDTDTLVSLYSDDFVFEDTSSGDKITVKGALKAYFNRLFSLPGVKFSDVRFFGCENRAAGEWVWYGKSLETGVDYAIRGASLFVLSEEHIKRETIFYDPRPINR